MEDFESKLKRVRLRAPSPELDERVLAQKPQRPVRISLAGRRVPFWLAAAAAVAMAGVGFATGLAWRRQQPIAAERRLPSPATIQVIYNSPAEGNPFDFTRASHFFPAGRLEATIQTSKGA